MVRQRQGELGATVVRQDLEVLTVVQQEPEVLTVVRQEPGVLTVVRPEQEVLTVQEREEGVATVEQQEAGVATVLEQEVDASGSKTSNWVPSDIPFTGNQERIANRKCKSHYEYIVAIIRSYKH